MGQNNAYAEWFINTMLGWIRWIANAIASKFQSSSSRGSVGGNFVSWFSENWITLLIVLVVLGVVLDWLVWMIRWRPYWLWFRRKRVLLDDDIDAILDDEELVRQYGAQKSTPHFKGSSLGRGSRPTEPDEMTQTLYSDVYGDEDYDDEFDAPDIEDRFMDTDPSDAYAQWDEDEQEVDEDADIERLPYHRAAPRPEESYEDYEKTRLFDELYTDAYSAHVDDEYDEDDEYQDGDEPDISFIEADIDAAHPAKRASSPARTSWEADGEDAQPRTRNVKPNWLFKLRPRARASEEDDPFNVDSAVFYDPDEDVDFLNVVASDPVYPAVDPIITDSYGVSTPNSKSPGAQSGGETEFSGELSPADWRTGYTEKTTSASAAPGSRRERRMRRERS